jgi:hypothetical protein
MATCNRRSEGMMYHRAGRVVPIAGTANTAAVTARR